MNIFFLSRDPRDCARLLHDRHVVSQLKETMQMIRTALSYRDDLVYSMNQWGGLADEVAKLCKATHDHHPIIMWVRDRTQHFMWTVSLLRYLDYEFTDRFGHAHAYSDVTRKLVQWQYDFYRSFVTPPLSAPPATVGYMYRPAYSKDEEANWNRVIAAYHYYYVGEKLQDARFTSQAAYEYWKPRAMTGTRIELRARKLSAMLRPAPHQVGTPIKGLNLNNILKKDR